MVESEQNPAAVRSPALVRPILTATAPGPGATTTRPALTRRHLLTLGAGVSGLALTGAALRPGRQAALAQSEHDGHDMDTSTPTTYGIPMGEWAPAPLVLPEERRAVDGVLETTLRAAYGYQDMGGYRLFTRLYEGAFPGPTLRLAPGDTLKIALTNDLPPNRDPAPADTDQIHLVNTTNFHFHGGHVDPGGISDNVLRAMEPGGTYDIEIAVPADHPGGTMWYHPHHHGGADLQIASGMAGALIVDGDFADVPEIQAAQEQVLVINEAVFDAFRTVEDFDLLWNEVATRFFKVNGQREPIITMRPGEVQRWRLVHTGYQSDILLNLEGHQLNVIAHDGIALDAMTTGDEELLAPGQRVDLLIKAGEPGRYLLQGLPNDQGYPSPTGPVAWLEVAGEPMEMALPTALPTPPYAEITDDELTGSRTLVLSAVTPEVASEAGGHWQEFAFLIDGQKFDPDRVDQTITLGAVEEWTITNVHEHDHIYHIHVNDFQVTQVNGVALDPPVWRDTVVVPRFGSIVYRSRFLDFTGMYVLHCHMMNHEEMGMMQLVEVVPA